MEIMESVLGKAGKEEGEAQPLYIHCNDLNIKCHWCESHFSGSQKLKHINQHVHKSPYHAVEQK